MSEQTIDLETELRYFNEHRFEMLREAAGRFALVKGDTLIGIFESETAAIRHGYEVDVAASRAATLSP